MHIKSYSITSKANSYLVSFHESFNAQVILDCGSKFWVPICSLMKEFIYIPFYHLLKGNFNLTFWRDFRNFKWKMIRPWSILFVFILVVMTWKWGQMGKLHFSISHQIMSRRWYLINKLKLFVWRNWSCYYSVNHIETRVASKNKQQQAWKLWEEQRKQ